MSSSGKDWLLVLRGLELVRSSFVQQCMVQGNHAWQNSSLQTLPKAVCSCITSSNLKSSDQQEIVKTVSKNVGEFQARLETFAYGVKKYQEAIARASINNSLDSSTLPPEENVFTETGAPWRENPPIQHTVEQPPERFTYEAPSQAGLDTTEPTVEGKSQTSQFKSHLETKSKSSDTKTQFSLKPSKVNLDVENDFRIETRTLQQPILVHPVQESRTVSETNNKQSLSRSSRERKVPASRLSRLLSYGSLGIGLGVGALAEVARRTVGVKSPESSGSILESSPFLTDANANRIVDTLCRVRGAALKLGQMLSLQDNSMINPQLQVIFERVRQSADFMPLWQMKRVLNEELGADWKSHFSTFEDQPFAAASIGQVHRGVLPQGTEVAIKVQYPGVAKGIDSDIDNLLALLKVWNILPKGLFVENLAVVARKELKWEVDYKREADCARKFKKLVESYPQYHVPEIIDSLSTERVLTSELIFGTPIDKMMGGDQTTRNWICEELLRLALLEVFRFNFMQTDPNWSNFVYNDAQKQINLLDFGACREYSKHFVDHYLQVIKGAIDADYEVVLKHSRILGFMTGYESKVMEEAHVEAAMALGEPFRHQGCFDFSHQKTTRKLHSLVPVMVQHRLTPPPEESYSLHRKLSGIFLLCTRLKANINCYQIFQKVLKDYKLESSSLS